MLSRREETLRASIGAVVLATAVALGCSASPSDTGTATNNAGTTSKGGASAAGGSAQSGGGGAPGGLGGTTSGGGSGGGDGTEVCGNGLDDDRDGSIDEDCLCTLGATQPCYAGSPEQAGKGACTFGSQTCEKASSSEFGKTKWGPCSGSGAPSAEQCTGGQDEDCDGLVDCGDPDCSASASCASCVPVSAAETAAQCSNGKDDDCDGLVDCGDPDCSASPSCGACTPVSGNENALQCSNGKDDDCDGQQDCADTDCCGVPGCSNPSCPTTTTEVCDGKDNDSDGRIDNGDVCRNFNGPCPPGGIRACDCYCGVHQKCQADGTWGPCKVDGSCMVTTVTQSSCPSGYCDFGFCTFGFLNNECVHHTDCPIGKICDLGSCINDPYTACQ